MKRLKYSPNNENGVSIHARDRAKHIAIKHIFLPDYSFQEYKIDRNVKVNWRFRDKRHSWGSTNSRIFDISQNSVSVMTTFCLSRPLASSCSWDLGAPVLSNFIPLPIMLRRDSPSKNWEHARRPEHSINTHKRGEWVDLSNYNPQCKAR